MKGIKAFVVRFWLFACIIKWKYSSCGLFQGQLVPLKFYYASERNNIEWEVFSGLNGVLVYYYSNGNE